MNEKNLSVVRQSFANTVFTHQVQEIAAQNKNKRAADIKWLNIVLTGAILTMLIIQAYNPANLFYSYLAAGVSVGEIIFLIIQLTFDFGKEAIQHKNSALKYMSLRDDYRLLITDIMNESITKKEIIARRNNLQNTYQMISDLAPNTTDVEYREAQVRLNVDGAVSSEQFTWSDDEIDRFLPESLRIARNKNN